MDHRTVTMTEKGASYSGKLQVEAYEAGRKAAAEGESREACPSYPRKSLAASWLKGWDDARPRVPVPEVRPQVAATAASRPLHPNAFWPAGQPMPEVYQRRPPIPCPSCRRVLDDDARQAVTVKVIFQNVAHLRCRCCGHGSTPDRPFKLRVV